MGYGADFGVGEARLLQVADGLLSVAGVVEDSHDGGAGWSWS